MALPGEKKATRIGIASNLSEILIEHSAKSNEFEFEAFVSPQDPIFRGHYPHLPILPGVLLLEYMELAFNHYALEHWGQRALLREIKRLTFYSPVFPGTTIRITGALLGEVQDEWLVRLQVEAGGLKAKATLIFRLSGDEH